MWIHKREVFSIVHVPDTTSLTLKNEICSVLSHLNLNIGNIRCQGYDGASNMRGDGMDFKLCLSEIVLLLIFIVLHIDCN